MKARPNASNVLSPRPVLRSAATVLQVPINAIHNLVVVDCNRSCDSRWGLPRFDESLTTRMADNDNEGRSMLCVSLGVPCLFCAVVLRRCPAFSSSCARKGVQKARNTERMRCSCPHGEHEPICHPLPRSFLKKRSSTSAGGCTSYFSP